MSQHELRRRGPQEVGILIVWFCKNAWLIKSSLNHIIHWLCLDVNVWQWSSAVCFIGELSGTHAKQPLI